MIKNIVFDMGKVLVKFEPDKYIAHHTSDKEDHALLRTEVFQSIEWIALDHGCIDQQEATRLVCKRLPHRLHTIASDLIHTWHLQREPVEGMEPLVKVLKENGYNLFVLSNISSAYHEIKEYIPALAHIDNEFLSYQWHMLKPSPEIYQGFYHHFGLIPKECLFIDDLAINIFMAQQSGMDGVIFRGDTERLREELQAKGVRIK